MKWHIRLAQKQDCRDIWTWRNAPEVRKWSFDSKIISYAQHRKWFKKKIRNQNIKIYIFEDEEGNKLGQVRFNIDNRFALINICLNPKYFGKGLGNKFLRTSTEFFLRDNPQVQEIIAKIIDQNIASKKAFQKAGYIFSHYDLNEGNKIGIFKKNKKQL